MYDEKLEQLIDAALADGELTEKEKQILFKKAQAMGVDLDEFEMVLDARLVKLQKAEAEKTASSAPKSNKFGDVKKCPACGALVQSYQGVCPECGYAFEGIDANSAVKELSNLLQKASKLEMVKIVDNFPIPMEKAAIMSFVTWLHPQSLDKNNPLAKAYHKKYEECINKIKVSFSNDKDLQKLIATFEEKDNVIKKQKKIIWGCIGIAALIAIVIFSLPAPINKNPEKCSAAIEKAIQNGETTKALTLYMNYTGKKYGKYELEKTGATMSLIQALLKENNIVDAVKVGIAAEIKYNSPSKTEATMASVLYDNCINHGDFETAKTIIQTATCDFEYYGQYIKDVVTYLCENGKKDEAQRFFNSNKGLIDNKSDKLGTHDQVVKMIQGIINSYK